MGDETMTRILAIEGTDIRVEITDCMECPCYGGRFGAVECEARGHSLRVPIKHPMGLDMEWISPDCPVPEKCPVCGAMMHPDYNFDREGEPVQIGWYCRECLHTLGATK